MTADQAPTHTLPNPTSTQPRGAEAEYKHKHSDVGGSSSSGSAPPNDTASGQQGGSSADPGTFLRVSSGVCGMDGCGAFAFILVEQQVRGNYTTR